MKLSDIVNQLRGVLPKYTDRFSTVLSVSSIVAAGGTATITTTTDHGLTSGANIVLRRVQSRTAINSATQDGLVFTFTTSTDHDLTLDWPEHENVELQGFTDPLWNGSFKLVSVSNRRTFSVQSTNALPVLNAGEVLLEIRRDGVNGRYSANVIDAVTFSVGGVFDDGNYTGGVVSTAQRIAGSVTEDRAIEQYTAQNINDLWMFVVMGQATVSKSRSSYSDATAGIGAGNDIRMRLIDGFSLFVIVNTADEISGTGAVDLCRHELLLPILKSVNGMKFDTGLTLSGDIRTIFLGHAVYDYNQAILIYQYDFEVSMDISNDDSVQPEDTRAFRDIDYTLGVGVKEMTTSKIDLDEVEI